MRSISTNAHSLRSGRLRRHAIWLVFIAVPPLSRIAIRWNSPLSEGKHLIDQIANLKVPVFVLTGGDPLKRPDLFELIGHARTMGVRVSLTPSATPLLTREMVVRLKQAGLARLAVSMDGACAETHDAFRGMSGSFARTLDAIRWANEIGLPVQINTTFSRRNIAEIDDLVALMESLQITLWSVFFLVPTGRGKLSDLLNAEEFEQVCQTLHPLEDRELRHQND